MEWGALRAEHRLLRQAVAGETVLRLVRLDQVTEEREVIEGQVRLCERGLERFARLAFLTSEQKAGRQALLWGRERLHLEVLDLDSEEDEIRMELSLAMGGGSVPSGVVLEPRAEWPPFPEPSKGPTSYLLAERYRRGSAQASVKREGRAAWPSVGLGPVFERETGGGERRDLLGATLSLTLPLWDRNGGDRDAAKALLREAVVKETSTEKRLERTRDLLRKRYAAAVQRLQGKERHYQDGVDRLAEIRTGYLEGRIHLALALEAYRELEGMIEHLHGAERSAYGALWTVYALEDLAEEKEP
jgi:outer membrane protein TolC